MPNLLKYAFFLILTRLPLVTVSAQTWDGGGTNSLWGTSTNWSTDTVPVSSATNELHFAGSTQLNNTNDMTGLTLSNLFFDASAGNFVLNGNVFNVFGTIQNNSGNEQTINNGINFQAPGTLHAAVGDLVFNGLINNGGFTLTTDGPFNIDLNNTLSGAGSLVKNGAGTLTLNASNNYGGSTFVNEGTLITSHSNALRGSPALTVQNGAKLLNTTTHPSGAGFFHNTAANRSALITGPGSLWSNAGVLTVGITGSLNSLTISNGGTVVSAMGIVGRATPSANNNVTVTGSGSIWTNSGILIIGGAGGTNSLILNHGARVYSSDGYVGSNSSFNAVSISGSDSAWILSSNLHLGRGSLGRNNQITISDGGSVSAFDTYVSLNNSSSSNGITVTGVGSVFSNRNFLILGGADGSLTGGDYNYLIISNGARVYNVDAFIGYDNDAVQNQVIVTGTNSLWFSRNDLLVGRQGDFNSLTVTDGGQVHSTNGYIGYNNQSQGNSVLLSGEGSVWSNANSLSVGRHGANNSLIISDGADVYADFDVAIGEGGTSSAIARSNSVVVTGSGSTLQIGRSLHVGTSFNSYNTLTISNGANVTAGGGLFSGNGASFLGTSSFNRIIVHGVGTTLSVADSLNVGFSGFSNSMIIAGGAQVSSGLGNIGLSDPASYNSVLVDGIGSIWTMMGELDVGRDTGTGTNRNNRLTISNGGLVVNADSRLGFAVNAFSNEVFVTGAYSTWSNQGHVVIGGQGYNNGVFIQNSGIVWAANITLGENITSSNNFLNMLDSTLTVTNMLNVLHGNVVINGDYASIGTLNVTNESTFTFNRGDLLTQNANVDNGLPFVVGDGNGIRNAVYTLGNQGVVNGHTFVNGLIINTNNLLVSSTSERMNDTTDLALLQSSRWNLSGHTETLRNLSFNGAELDAAAGAVLNVTSGFITNEIGGATIEMTGGSLVIDAAIVGEGGLTKTGVGGLILDAANTYTGATTIAGGTFTVNGTMSTSDNGVTLQNGTTLSGTGSVDRAVTMESGSILSPGFATGVLTVATLTLQDNVMYIFEKNLSESDRVDVAGALTFDTAPSITLKLVESGGASYAGITVLIRYGSSDSDVNWIVDTSDAPSAVGGYVQNNTVDNQWEYVTVPEPTTLALLTIALMLASRRRIRPARR